LFFYPLIIYCLFDNPPNILEQAVSTRNSRAKFCPTQSVILAASSFETRKKHFKPFSGKDDKKGRKNLKTYELFICRDLR